MPWTPVDAQKHDKSANTPEKAKRWAKIANGVLKSTGSDASAIRVANSRVEGVESFLDRLLEGQKLERNKLTLVQKQESPGPVRSFFGRVFTEADAPKIKVKPKVRVKSTPPKITIKTKKPGFFSRVAKGWGNIERASHPDPGQRGERPKFLKSPLAHIVHRAAERKYGEKGKKSEKVGKPKKGRAWSPGSPGKGGTKPAQSAENIRKQIKLDTAKESARRTRQRGGVQTGPQWGRSGEVVRPVQVPHLAQPFIPPPPKMGRQAR